MKKHKFLTVTLAVSMIIPNTAIASSITDFKDFPDDWSKSAMTWMVNNSYLKGDEGYIKPLGELTRAEMATIINRVFNLKTTVSLDSFIDIDKNSWYYNDLAIAVANGILKGDENKLRPLDKITRAEAFVVLSRALKLNKVDSSILNKFNDYKDIPSWAVDDVSALVNAGYVNGNDGLLSPNNFISRAEFSQILYNTREIIGNNGNFDNSENSKSDKSNSINNKYFNKSSINTGIPLYYYFGADNNNYSRPYPVEPTNKEKPSKPVEPTKPVEPSKPIEPSKPVEPSKPIEPSKPEKPKEEADIVTDNTKLVDLSWSQFVAIEFQEGYNLENCKLEIDGVDITEAITPVTTDGKIVKWEITDLNPNKLVASCGDKKEEVLLSDNTNPKKPTIKKDTSPGFIIAHGPVSVWDYHLDRYDKNGKIKIEPTRTTINLNNEEVKTDAPDFYSPDTEVDKDFNGEILIKFSNKTEKDREWFNKIENAELVTFDEYQKSINSNLEFEAISNVKDGAYEYAALKIKTPQTNLRSNKRYYVRVKSLGHDSVLVPIHLVNDKKPSLQLSGNGTINQNTPSVSFNVKDMTYGILDPIKSVSLTYPDNSVKTLDKIKDYYLMGDKFNLYNKVEDGIPSLFTDNGIYTLNIVADGFKPFKTTFSVAKSNPSNNMALKVNRVDTLSGATTKPTSINDEASGGVKMTADIKFNADLLINSMILNNIGVENSVAKSIVERWQLEMAGWDSVGSKNSDKLYKWDSYINAVDEARTKGDYLSFSEYITSDNIDTRNHPYALKSVLEDGSLGKTQYNGEWKGSDIPELKLVNENGEKIDTVYENTVRITTEDINYLNSIKEIKLNGNYQALSKDKYSIENGMLTINAILKEDEANTIRIESEGYKPALLTVNHKVKLEENITIKPEKENYKIGEKVTLVVDGSNGDYLKRIVNTKIKYPNNNETIVDHKKSYSLTEYYNIEDNKLVFSEDVFKEVGAHSITINADKYQPLTVKISIEKSEDEVIDTNTKDAPLPKETYNKNSGMFGNYYEVEFSATNTEAKSYLNAITEITVDEIVYAKADNLFKFKENSYLLRPDAFGVECKLGINFDGFTTNSPKVKIKAKGYTDLEFSFINGKVVIDKQINNNNNDNTDGSIDKNDYIEIVAIERDSFDGVYKLFFNSDVNKDEYIKSVTKIIVNDSEELTPTVKSAFGAYGSENILTIPNNNINKKGEYKITLISKKFKDQTFKIVNNKLVK